MNESEKLAFADQTIVHPLGLALWAAMAFLLFRLPRARALVPVFVIVCFIPPAQRITVAGLDFTLLRLLLIVGWLRVLVRGENRGFRFLAIDRAFVAYVAATVIANSLLRGTTAGVVYNLGLAFDLIGSYFLARWLIRSFEDLDAMIGGIACIAIALAFPFLLERHIEPHRNLFSVFGGVSEFTSAREGKVRAHGAFPHAILAGCFWAALLPLLIARLRTRPHRRALAVAGIASALAMIHATASSTPAAGAMAAIVAACSYPLRTLVGPLRWGVAFAVVGLHIAMTMPVWHLVARIDLVGGSTGWHRYFLIDQAIRRFPEWWLIGTPSTAHWGHQLFDVTNQYVLEGVRGGVFSLALFVLLLALSFRGVGRAVRATEGDPPRQLLAWMLGAALFTHATMFIAVSYFGQLFALWTFTLAAIASLEERVRTPERPRGIARVTPATETVPRPVPS